MLAASRYTLLRNQKNLFIISLEYKVSLEQVTEHLDAHRTFLDECYEAQYFVASGPKEPRSGGIIIARASSQQELAELLSKDPFCIHGIADYQITLFHPSKASDEFRTVLEKPEPSTSLVMGQKSA